MPRALARASHSQGVTWSKQNLPSAPVQHEEKHESCDEKFQRAAFNESVYRSV
ncbi:MAG TPA: hypothetical protein VEY11_06365 [Pyrinomonadaceae bacterium]|nr:hypothetical protein [Pyrinomonadaceae bacterium]